KGINFSLKDYLILVDETGRVISDDKRGAISASAERILSRLNIPAANWVKIITEFGQLFHGPVGTLQELSSYCEHLDKRRRHFSNSCQYMQVG
ncbi:transposase, partial [Shewanella sp. Bg11-22]